MPRVTAFSAMASCSYTLAAISSTIGRYNTVLDLINEFLDVFIHNLKVLFATLGAFLFCHNLSN